MQVKDKLIFRLATVFGLIGIILGSLGAHGLKFESDYHHGLFDTGLLYIFIHIPVMMILGVVGMRNEALLMMAGLGAFTFPLIVKGVWGISGGILVPVGGMILIAAWLWVLIVGGDVKNEESK